MRKNYKGILGLNTVKAFVIVMLALAIISVVTLVVLGALNTGEIREMAVEYTDTAVANNETLTTVTEAGEDNVWATKDGAVCTTLVLTNETGSTIVAANYTQSGCSLAYSGVPAGNPNNTNWNWTYSYYYLERDPVNDVTQNTSAGITTFFSNSLTFFSLLGVVVIILIISLVVVVVNRFGGEGGTRSAGATV